jgi:hypothetical protein
MAEVVKNDNSLILGVNLLQNRRTATIRRFHCQAVMGARGHIARRLRYKALSQKSPKSRSPCCAGLFACEGMNL